MKTIKALAVIVFFFQGSVIYSQHITNVTPKVQEVIVYLAGAEMRFTESISLRRGDNVIYLRGLSPSLVRESIQISVAQSAAVVSVSTDQEKILPGQVSTKIKILTDSITTLEDAIALLTNKINAYEMEKRTLEQNLKLGGTQTGVSLIELTKAADFFRERTLKIENNLTSLTKTLKILNTRLAERREELHEETTKININRSVIQITVNSKDDQKAEFSVRYLIEDGSWEPSYDIIAKEINNPVTLAYKALVYNNSGTDWKDVKISLSTGDISLNASRPYLTAWTLNYTSRANEGYLNTMTQNNIMSKVDSVETATEEKAVSELNTSFNIDQRHSIRADGLPYRISLISESLPATFEYLAIPKIELSAFLIAKVTGWEKLNLIDGVANVYFGNTYIGESNINTRLIGDTLELSLGRDNQIVVSRTKVEDKGNTPVIGGKRSESFIYEILLRNNRKVPVAIKVQDQIPVSQEKDIVVDMSDISGASLDQSSGRLQWIKNLSAGESTRFRISFVVKYPKNQTVNIRKSRLVQTPRYRQ